MNLDIKKIHYQNFKSFKDKSVELSKKTVVSGANGLGKTTIADGFLWVMANVNSSLESNPSIFPIGIEEATPVVTIEMEVDGRPLTVARKVKRSVKKSRTGEADSVTYTSTYEVNSVEYGLRDFNLKMAEYGIDLDKFLPLSNTEVFVSKKTAEMREILMKMASNISDLEIARLTEGASEVAKLAENYTLEEIASMQKASLRKVAENYGKDGEILRAKIEGLEEAKVDMDVSSIELAKADLNRRLQENAGKQIELEKSSDRYRELSNEVMELKFQLGDIVRNESKNLADVKGNKLEEIRQRKSEQDKLKSEREALLREKLYTDNRLNNNQERVKELRKVYDEIKNRSFDESKTICPVCHREFEAEKVESIKADFETNKARDMDKVQSEGNSLVEQNKADKKALGDLTNKVSKIDEKIKSLEIVINGLMDEYTALPTEADGTQLDGYKALDKLLKSKEEELSAINVNEERMALKHEESILREELTNCEREIAKFSRNNEIDETIAGLRMKQQEYEQDKADAENILYQLDLVSKKSNELLTDEINKHFDLVTWKFFDYQKNGGYKNCCDAYIGDKKLGESMNTALELKAKVDICNGLSRFYGQYYPIFIDGAECLDSYNTNALECSSQLILLNVTDDKELTVKEIKND